MIKIGNFFFHYRNMLFPLFYLALFIPSPPIFANYILAFIIGLLIVLSGQFIRGITIGFVYIVRGGKNRQVYAEDLVTGGLFSTCRNPMYVGNVLIIAGMGVIANSLLFTCIFLPFFIFIYEAIIRAEENFLHNKFGEQFEHYKRTVNRWIPNFSGISKKLEGSEFKWQRVLIKEYNSTYIWMSGVVLLVAKHLYFNHNTAFDHYLPFLIAAMVLLLLAYGFVRSQKKSKRWVG